MDARVGHETCCREVLEIVKNVAPKKSMEQKSWIIPVKFYSRDQFSDGEREGLNLFCRGEFGRDPESRAEKGAS